MRLRQHYAADLRGFYAPANGMPSAEADVSQGRLTRRICAQARYLDDFLGFAVAALDRLAIFFALSGAWGVGGVLSIRNSTSSSRF